MRKTLIINSGSSSIKYRLYTMPKYEVDCEGIVERIGIENSQITLSLNGEKSTKIVDIKDHEIGINILLELLEEKNLISNKEEITRVGHRIVQGGEVFKESCVIDDEKLEAVYDLAKLAPLHNKANADGIKVFKKLLPHAINVGVFDTEFHQTMPEESFMYAVPFSWYKDYGVRRYGMHGTSHKFIAMQVAKFENNDKLKIINCHLGNGASLCAIDSGVSVQTSMGLTPLAGIAMGTRSGDIDPSIFEYMNNQTGMSVQEITSILNKESGVLGLSGVSSDFRDLNKAYEEGNERAVMSLNIYVTRIVETIGSYFVRLNGVDVISFTGGIGENDCLVRKLILERLSSIGVILDNKANEDRSLGDNRIITTKDSKVKAWIITTDEEFQIANEAERF